MKLRLDRKFEAIAAGIAKGHKRDDVSPELPLLFENERPFVIAFDAGTRRIVRVIHGRRDFPRLFGGA
jgi:plasmid stabilization system protein ParE